MEGLEDTSTRICPHPGGGWKGLLGPSGWRDQAVAQPKRPSGRQHNWAGLLGPRWWLGKPEGIRGDNSEEKMRAEVRKSVSQKTW